jgi:hypothetical protein
MADSEAVTAKYVSYSSALALDDLEFEVVWVTCGTPVTGGIIDKVSDQQCIKVQFGFLWKRGVSSKLLVFIKTLVNLGIV